MRVLGVDPGTAVTGYGVVTGESPASLKLLECGVVRTKPRESLALRLLAIYEGIVDIIERHRPDCICVEDVFYARNVRTTVVLGHARGVILLAAARAGLEVHELPPAEIKKAVVGSGSASKAQVQFMVARVLRLKTVPEPADAADGVAAALAVIMRGRLPRIEDIRVDREGILDLPRSLRVIR